jgi:large subunit ribosomal protein L24
MAKRIRIRRDDQVKVISGKDSGRTGRVLRVDREKGRVFVEGMNIQKRHQRPRTLRDVQRGGEVGGIVEREGPIHISNVMLLDPKTQEPTRVGVSRESGQRTRIGRKSGEAID